MTGEFDREESKVPTFLAMLQTEPTEMDCQRCVAQLTDYVSAQLDKGDYQHQFPVVAQHLDSCVLCAEMYARVYEVELADRNGRLPHPASIPQPDLSFLGSRPSLWAVLQIAFQQTQTRLTLQLDAALAALLTPQPSLALTRSGDDARFGEQILSLTPDQVPETELPFSLAAYADKENPNQCLVEITVEPSGSSWPDLGGSNVRLRYGEVVLAEITDDWGTAVFPDIPRADLKNLQFEITF
ncbi:MAG: hypothetical protein IAF02_13820 [Anaerolineae bacterium]|nr:hypothetical protein [Anaerolineae bacterium]